MLKLLSIKLTDFNIKYDELCDTRGLKCPYPLAKAKAALSNLSDHKVLLVISDDPSSKLDFEVFTRQRSHLLLKSWQQANNFLFLIKCKH